MSEVDLKTYRPAETVPPELLRLAEAHYSMHGNGLLFNLIAAVLPEHERMVREQAAKAIEAERDDVASNEGATIADERVITSRCNGLAHAARIARGGVSA